MEAPIDDPQFARNLRRILERECAAHKKYASLIAKEQEAVVRCRTDLLASLTAQREILAGELEQMIAERKSLLEKYPQSSEMRLSAFISRYMNRDAQRTILPAIDALRKEVSQTRRSGGEFERIVGFSLRVANSLASILRSAAEHVTRGYGRDKQSRESYQRRGPLKEV